MTILLTALAFLTGAANQPVPFSSEIYVRTNPKVSGKAFASALRPIGKIESREKGASVYLIQLNPGVDADEARERLGKVPGIHPMEPEEEPVDMTSVRSLSRKIAHLSEDEKEEREKGNAKKAVHEKDKVDYLKSYRYFVGQRAFPNDKVNWDATNKAKEHARSMPKTDLLRTATGIHPDTATLAWQFVGPVNLQVPYQQYYGIGPLSGRVNAVAFDPNNSQTIYAGSGEGGLFRSTDSGATWTWLSSSWSQLAVNSIVIDPSNSSTIYVARGDYHGEIAGSYGIMKSTDGGTTWTEIAEAAMGKIGVASLQMDPTNNQILIAGTGDVNTYGKIYRSTNGGSTWSALSINGTDDMWPALGASLPSNGQVRLFAVAGGYAQTNNSTSRLFKSDDHGATWQSIACPAVIDGNFHWAYAITTSPTNSNNVYVLDSENQALYTSSTQGASWTDESANLPTGNEISTNYNFSQSFYDYHLECGNRVSGSTNLDVLYLGEIDITESLDGGKTWISIGGPTYGTSNAISHNDQHCLAVSPTNPNNAVFSNDGGVYALSYNGSTSKNTVTPLNANLTVAMYYKLAPHPTNSDYILGGTQDNASPITVGDLTTWYNVGGGDGGGSAINQSNPNVQYTSSEDLVIYQTPDGWNTENYISPSTLSTENSPFVTPMTLDPSSPNLMYVATNYLYQWNETTQTWKNRLGNKDLTNDNKTSPPDIQAIAIAPTDSTRIYTGSSDGALYMSTNQGSTWKLLNPGTALAAQAITSISVSPTNSSDILIGMSGAGSGSPHLYRCTNTTASSVAFSVVSGSGTSGLPDVSLNAIARDLDNPANTWWVAMDVGVFQTTNSGQTWTNASTAYGLPNVIVDDLVAVPGTRFLNAGTYGRGVWRLNLPTQSQVPTLTNFVLSPTSVAIGSASTGTVTLSMVAPTGGVVVNLASSSTKVATVPSTVTVPAGATSATFQVTASATLTAASSAVITATYNGVSLTQDMSVSVPKLASLALSPTSLIGGASSTGTVSLTVAAPTGGATVNLTSSKSTATVPTSVVIPAGATSATFAVSTLGVSASTTSTISAKLGTVSKTEVLTIKPQSVQSVTITPTSLVGGSQSSVVGTITLTGNAPAGGAKVTLSSSSTAAATVPASVIIPAGTTSATFTINHLLVTASKTVTIKATYGGVTSSATLTVTPFLVTSLTLTPISLVGGTSVSGSVALSATAGTGASKLAVKMTSSATSAVPPASVSIAQGASGANFTITTKAVAKATTVTITATVGTSAQKVAITLLPPTLTSLSVSPSTVQGVAKTVVSGTVTLSSPAPTGGFSISLKSSNTAAATVPATVLVPAGKLTGTFTVSHKKVTASQAVTITASQSSTSQTAGLTVTP